MFGVFRYGHDAADVERHSPTREELARVLDDVFRRVLDDGERNRAEREAGAPDWIPEPQTDPRYEGPELEDWDKVLTWPELWAREWQDAVLLNRLSDVEPLVEDALEARDLALPRTGTGWRRFLRLALLAAAGAHRIDARREVGDYSQGWPMQCGIPEEQVPAFGPELPRSPHSTRHTFADALRGSALGRDALVDQIMGHEPGGVGAKAYTRALPLTEKASLVASVCFDRLTDLASKAEGSPSS